MSFRLFMLESSGNLMFKLNTGLWKILFCYFILFLRSLSKKAYLIYLSCKSRRNGGKMFMYPWSLIISLDRVIQYSNFINISLPWNQRWFSPRSTSVYLSLSFVYSSFPFSFLSLLQEHCFKLNLNNSYFI